MRRENNNEIVEEGIKEEKIEKIKMKRERGK